MFQPQELEEGHFAELRRKDDECNTSLQNKDTEHSILLKKKEETLVEKINQLKEKNEELSRRCEETREKSEDYIKVLLQSLNRPLSPHKFPKVYRFFRMPNQQTKMRMGGWKTCKSCWYPPNFRSLH